MTRHIVDPDMSKKIGVIGSGEVGQTLALGFLKHGHEVMIGTRHPSKLGDWAGGEGKGVQVGDFAETASFGDVVVLAVKGTAIEDALRLAGIESLSGKTIIDASNPLDDEEPVNGVLISMMGANESMMEKLQALVPEANFVKAFNSVGAALMVNPELPGGKPSMFICGNSDDAKAEVSHILDVFGWEVEDMGGVEAARAIEPLAVLWCIPGFLRNDWVHAFKVLRP